MKEVLRIETTVIDIIERWTDDAGLSKQVLECTLQRRRKKTWNQSIKTAMSTRNLNKT